MAFDSQEALLYARAQGLDPQRVAQASQRVSGWAAGLRLLSNDLATPAAGAGPSSAPQALFDYFAGLLLDRLDAAGQHLMLVAALLPWVPAPLLAQVAHDPVAAPTPDAQALLERLCTQHLFVERVEPTNGVYRLHPLLRDFLQERGRRLWSPVERQSLLRAAARAFGAQGQTEVELDLLLDAGDAAAAVPRLLDLLESRLALGRLDQLAAWFSRLPPALLERQPALHYGLARLCFLREDAAALDHYERACNAFAAQGELHGQQLCAAGVLEWSYNSDSFLGHERWSALLRAGPPAFDAADAPAQSLRLHNGRLLACFFDGNFDADAARWIEEGLAVIQPGEAANERLLIGVTLLGCLDLSARSGCWRNAAHHQS